MTEPEPNPQFEALLRYLKETRGFDFTGYKRTSLMRRVSRRMKDVEVEGFDDYLDFLQVHPEEFTRCSTQSRSTSPASSATRRPGIS